MLSRNCLQPPGLRLQRMIRMRVLMVGLLSAGLLIIGWQLRGRELSSAQSPAPKAAGTLTIVVRTPVHLDEQPSQRSIESIVRTWSRHGVGHVLLQFKQDETDEHLSGTLFYPSRRFATLVAPDYRDDRIGRLIDALVVAGIRVSGLVPCFHDQRSGRLHADWRSRKIDESNRPVLDEEWLCPRRPAAREYEAAVVEEIVEMYPRLSGISLDFIRYDSDYSCVCRHCLREFERRTKWSSQHGRPLGSADILAAGQKKDDLWQAWIRMRSESITRFVGQVRNAIDGVRPDLHLGVCVLPFSAVDYSVNTQSGQDLEDIAQTGVDEILLMGYWDDWEKTPAWLNKCISGARTLLEDQCDLLCLLDGDMSSRRTRITLDAIAAQPVPVGFFNYWEWTRSDLDRITYAQQRQKIEGFVPAADYTAVVIRVDTEPDNHGRYDTLTQAMILNLADLFESEGIHGTFITCAKLAELQPDAIHNLVRRGHEIGIHAYNHEQIDDYEDAQQITIIDHSLNVFERLHIPYTGFGAPRNSITDVARDRLMERGIGYDGSDSYDPLLTWMDPYFAEDSFHPGRRIPVVPYVEPNDWDARRVNGWTAEQMVDAWKKRLDVVCRRGQPCFVLDIHQWLAAEPDNFRAVRSFIRYAKSKPHCRLVTLREAADHATKTLEQFEQKQP